MKERWTDNERRGAKQLRDEGYEVRRCKKCGSVQYKKAHKWRCAKCK